MSTSQNVNEGTFGAALAGVSRIDSEAETLQAEGSPAGMEVQVEDM